MRASACKGLLVPPKADLADFPTSALTEAVAAMELQRAGLRLLLYLSASAQAGASHAGARGTRAVVQVSLLGDSFLYALSPFGPFFLIFERFFYLASVEDFIIDPYSVSSLTKCDQHVADLLLLSSITRHPLSACTLSPLLVWSQPASCYSLWLTTE